MILASSNLVAEMPKIFLVEKAITSKVPDGENEARPVLCLTHAGLWVAARFVRRQLPWRKPVCLYEPWIAALIAQPFQRRPRQDLYS